MRVVLQRVLEAKVIVDHHPVGEIKKGLLILVGRDHGLQQKNSESCHQGQDLRGRGKDP